MFARTDRLLLRPGWIEDAPALAEAIADEAIVRNLARAPWPYCLSDAEVFLSRERTGHDPVSLITMRMPDGPRVVGCIGLDRMEDGSVELGYWVARPYWGQGIATEAGRAVIANARDTLRLERITASHFLDNPASGRLLRKLGFRPTGKIAPRYSAGRQAEAPTREYALDLESWSDVVADEAGALAA